MRQKLSVPIYYIVCMYNVHLIKSNQINIHLIRWQIATTDTDAKVVYNYIGTKLLEGRRTKLSSGLLNLTTNSYSKLCFKFCI